mmetsp:Transcript_23357/g.42937  ORF Transcript_23357/g.42937 Transcript_23357/m.42937 type:complete len:664 (+) Transcript_23357:102-2093(+)
MSQANRATITFRPFLPSPDVAFWQELTRRKLDVMRLDDSAVPLHACYQAAPSDGVPEKCFLLGAAFDEEPKFQAGTTLMAGSLKNFNTVEDFRNFLSGQARADLVSDSARTLQQAILSGAALDNPVLLRPFLVVAFADLKKYHYSFTVAFPVLEPKAAWTFTSTATSPLDAGISLEVLQDLARRIRSDQSEDKELARAGVFTLRGGAWLPLAAVKEAGEDAIVGFVDPSSSPDAAGWPLRNILAALSKHCPGPRKILSFRDPTIHARPDTPVRSLVFHVDIAAEHAATLLDDGAAATWIAGWSKVQTTDLTTFLDKGKIAADAVDLNVKLIKWRILPELEPERMKRTRFLLLGAGTLGCSLARALIGWGVRHITFVDSGKVSYSNPVRQSLFTHKDAAEGRLKAEVASESIKAVMPDAECRAVVLDIPMPGHPQTKPDVLRSNIQKMRELVNNHDVVCMLTDSRESRWLPSLMVAASQQGEATPPLGLTVALGFDSFLVSRQTYRSAEAACYFCNDVTAPSDSLAFRTLDQQCTVTRPGLSGMAAGVAAELLASLVQHVDGFGAPSSTTHTSTSLLGATPHQIRGYLSEFRLAPVDTEPFPKCICCSAPVLDLYRKEGDAFVERVVTNSAELEDVSGLKAMKAAVCEDDVVSFDDIDDLPDGE